MDAGEPAWPAERDHQARRGILAAAWRTLLDGLMVVVPIGAVLLLVLGIVDRLRHLTDPLAGRYLHPLVAAAAMFVLLTVLVGLLVHSAAGRAARRWLDAAVLDRVPGYRLAKALVGGGSGLEAGAGGAAMRPHPALARIEDGLCPAFILDRFADGRLVVFVPGTPAVMAGSLYVFTPDRVVPLDVALMPFELAVASWGLGLRELLEAAEARERAAASGGALPGQVAAAGGRTSSP
jgi:uncharacterized membrane protein